MQFYSFFFFLFCPHSEGLPPFLSFFLFLISHCKHAESHYTVSHFLLFSNFVVSVRHCFTRVFIFCQCRLATPSLAQAIVSLEKTRLPQSISGSVLEQRDLKQSAQARVLAIEGVPFKRGGLGDFAELAAQNDLSSHLLAWSILFYVMFLFWFIKEDLLVSFVLCFGGVCNRALLLSKTVL
jgi:hypothetical protein